MGTFPWSFPPYRSPNISIRGVWDIAHSTPLELASEVGLPLAGLIALGWLIMFCMLARGILGRHRDVVIPLAAAGAAGLSLLHSLLDFTLQIPGYSLPFFALFGAGLAQSFRSPDADGGGKLRISGVPDAQRRSERGKGHRSDPENVLLINKLPKF